MTERNNVLLNLLIVAVLRMIPLVIRPGFGTENHGYTGSRRLPAES